MVRLDIEFEVSKELNVFGGSVGIIHGYNHDDDNLHNLEYNWYNIINNYNYGCISTESWNDIPKYYPQ